MAATQPLLSDVATETDLEQRLGRIDQRYDKLNQRLDALLGSLAAQPTLATYPHSNMEGTPRRIKSSHSNPSPTRSEHEESDEEVEGCERIVSYPFVKGGCQDAIDSHMQYLELAFMSKVNQRFLSHSNLEPLPAEVVLMKEPPFEFSSSLAVPTDPRVASLCKEYWPDRVNVGTQCSGPAFVYSMIANVIVHSSVILLTIIVFVISACQGQSGAASYPTWILIPVCFTAFSVIFLECQALRYYTLSRILLLEKLTLPLVGSVSYYPWLCYNEMMTFVGVVSMHTSAFAVAQTLKGYYFCNSKHLLDLWADLMTGKLHFLWNMWHVLNPAILLLFIWILGSYPVLRAWTQSVRMTCIKSEAFPFIKKWNHTKYPDDIENGFCEVPGAINYTPQVVFKQERKGPPRKLEVRWVSLAYKLKFEIWFSNFGMALSSNAKVCGWAAVSSFLFPSELAKLTSAEEKLDAVSGDTDEGLGRCVNESYYLSSKVLVSVISFVFLRGTLVLLLKLSVFDLQQTFSHHATLSLSQAQVLFSMALSFGLLCLDLMAAVPIVLKSEMILRKVTSGVDGLRKAYQQKLDESPARLKESPSKEEEGRRRMFERFVAARRAQVKIVVWLGICAALLMYAFVKVVLDMLKI